MSCPVKHEPERSVGQFTPAFSTETLREIIGSAMDAIISTDASQRIILFNPAAEKMFGLSSAAALGSPLNRFIPDRFREQHLRHVEDFGRTGVSTRRMGSLGTLSALRATGEEFPIEASISQVEVDGQKIFTVILRDITDRQRNEEALRAAKEELARANADLERVVLDRTARLRETITELEHMSYSIVHDMRAPLRALQGYSEILRERLEESLDEESRDFLRRMTSAVRRMDQLITDALRYNKAVREEIPLGRVDAASLLKSVIESYPNLHSPEIRIRMEGNFPPVLANEAGLAQCVGNLLGNAVKFVAPGTPPKVRVYAQKNGQFVRLWFEDNGIGISKEFQTRIFGMFQRGSRDHEGTGIGLALVRKVVERMRGHVGVESEPGKGSRFWIELLPA